VTKIYLRCTVTGGGQHLSPISGSSDMSFGAVGEDSGNGYQQVKSNVYLVTGSTETALGTSVAERVWDSSSGTATYTDTWANVAQTSVPNGGSVLKIVNNYMAGTTGSSTIAYSGPLVATSIGDGSTDWTFSRRMALGYITDEWTSTEEWGNRSDSWIDGVVLSGTPSSIRLNIQSGVNPVLSSGTAYWSGWNETTVINRMLGPKSGTLSSITESVYDDTTEAIILTASLPFVQGAALTGLTACAGTYQSGGDGIYGDPRLIGYVAVGTDPSNRRDGVMPMVNRTDANVGGGSTTSGVDFSTLNSWSNVSALAGDCLVVEFGGNNSDTDYSATAVYQTGTTGSDLTNGGNGTTNPGWVELTLSGGGTNHVLSGTIAGTSTLTGNLNRPAIKWLAPAYTVLQKTGGEASGWYSFDLSSLLPSDATGVILRFHCESSNHYRYGAKATGVSDPSWMSGGNFDRMYSHAMHMVASKLSASRSVDVYCYTTTGANNDRYAVVGYTTSEGDVTWTDINSVSDVGTAAGTAGWVTLTDSSAPTGAIAGIYAVMNLGGTSAVSFNVRPTGSSWANVSSFYQGGYWVVPLNSSKQFDAYRNANYAIDMRPIAYFLHGVIVPVTETGWTLTETTPTDIPTPPSGATGMFLRKHQYTNAQLTIRTNSNDAADNGASSFSNTVIGLGANANNALQIAQDSVNTDSIYLQAYTNEGTVITMGSVDHPLQGTVAGIGTINGAATVNSPLGGSLIAQCSFAGDLRRQYTLAGGIAGACTIAGSVGVNAPLVATMAGTGAGNALLAINSALSGAIAGLGSFSGNLYVPTTVDPPTNVVLSLYGDDRLITWDPVDGATSYLIERRVDGGSWVPYDEVVV